MLNVPNRSRAAGAYAPAAARRRIEALARTCPVCKSGPKEWCVRVVHSNTNSGERGETPYPIRVKRLHVERFADGCEGEEDDDAGPGESC